MGHENYIILFNKIVESINFEYFKSERTNNKWNYYGYTSYGWTVFVNQDKSCFLIITGDGLMFYSSINSLRQNEPMLELLRSDVNDVEIMCDILNSGYIDNKYIMAKHNNDMNKLLENL